MKLLKDEETSRVQRRDYTDETQTRHFYPITGYLKLLHCVQFPELAKQFFFLVER